MRYLDLKDELSATESNERPSQDKSINREPDEGQRNISAILTGFFDSLQLLMNMLPKSATRTNLKHVSNIFVWKTPNRTGPESTCSMVFLFQCGSQFGISCKQTANVEPFCTA